MTIVESTPNMVKEVLMFWRNALKGLFNNYIAYEYGDLKPNKEDKKDYKYKKDEWEEILKGNDYY